MAPKLFARVARFDHAVALLRRDRVASLAELAGACGYADQAHLTRDFCEFAGSPPAAFLRRKLPDDGGFCRLTRDNRRSEVTKVQDRASGEWQTV